MSLPSRVSTAPLLPVSEARSNERAEIRVPVRFGARGGVERDCVAKNVSLGGMFIETDAPASFGATIAVKLDLPPFGVASIVSVVRWARPDGMGVQFGTMGARETHALIALVRARTPVP